MKNYSQKHILNGAAQQALAHIVFQRQAAIMIGRLRK
jgi:hypothetical protein